MEFENVLPSEIEKRSFEIIESELPHDIEKTIKPIVKRVIHTTADFDYLDNLCFSENVVEIIKNAIKNGADIVTDTQMARSGINKNVLRYMAERYIVLCPTRTLQKPQRKTALQEPLRVWKKRQNLKKT